MSILLIDNLPLVASAPSGVKKLRQLILELAVQGKLVPQDPKDEPAAMLIERAQSEKIRLLAKMGTNKNEPISQLGSVEFPYEIPEGWCWTRLLDLAQINPRNSTKDEVQVSFVPMPLIGTSFNGQHKHEQRYWKEVKQGYTHFAEGDIGVAKITPCFENSKACVFSGLINGMGAGTTELHIVRPIAGTLEPRYVLAYLKAPYFLRDGESRMTGTAGQKRLPKDFVELNPFPLPPLPEQHRIVSKIYELMDLCDRLEAQQADAESAHTLLVKAFLNTLTQSRTQSDFATSWESIKQSFDTLFTTDASIDALKQTLIHLTVMGRLLPQDPKDEPASELLKRLRIERGHWLKSQSANNPECRTMLKKLANVSTRIPPFTIPKSWSLTRLIDCSRLLVDCHNKTAPYVKSGIPLIRTSNIRDRKFRWIDLKYVSEETHNYWSRRCPPEAGDIIFTREAPMGEAAIIENGERYCLGQRTMLIRPMHNYVDNRYVLFALTEPGLLTRALPTAVGSTVQHLRVGDVENLFIPLPPLAEQRRIIAKLDELTLLCDRLKEGIATSLTLQGLIATTLIEDALNGKTSLTRQQEPEKILVQTDVLLQKRRKQWYLPYQNELDHTFHCIRQLKKFDWAAELVLKVEPAIQLMAWLQENSDKTEHPEWLERWDKLEQLRPFLFEARYAYDIGNLGITPKYEAKTLEDSSIDFKIEIDGVDFLIELVSTLQTEAITENTEYISSNTRIVGSNDAEELRKVQGKIVRKVARKKIVEEVETYVPHKFPLPIGADSRYNVIIVDTRGFSGGDDLDSAKEIQLVYGTEHYLAQGGSELCAYSIDKEPLAGLFDVHKSGEEAQIFRERVHLLGLVSEKTFGKGEVIQQTHIFRNQLLDNSKTAEEQFQFKLKCKSN